MQQKREHNFEKGDASYYMEKLRKKKAAMSPEELEELKKRREQLEKKIRIIGEGED